MAEVAIPGKYVPLVVRSLEEYAAYLRASGRDCDECYEAAEWFKRLIPRDSSEENPKRRSKRPRADHHREVVA